MDEKKVHEEFNKQPEKKLKPEKEVKVNKKNNIVRAINYLKTKYEFLYNDDTSEIDFKEIGAKDYKTITDKIYRYLRTELEMQGISLTDDTFRNMIYSGYFFESYNPIKSYLFNLPKWDGKDYLQEWCQQVNLIDEEKYRKYFVDGFKKWFVALVMSLVTDIPTSKNTNQVCLIFTGKQGKYKSTFFENLLPMQLRLRYFLTGIYNFHSEEHQKYLGTKIIIHLEELAGFNRADIEAIKTRISQSQATFRLRFGKADSEWKRRASFTAATNEDEFLNDMSGTRRFFTVPVSKIYINDDLNVDNIYSQALALYKDGYRYWFDEDDITEIESMNEDFKSIMMEEEMILSHFIKPSDDELKFQGRVSFMNSTGIANWLSKKFERLNVNNSVTKNIGKALRKNGFKKVSKSVNGESRKLWAIILKDEPVIQSIDSNEMVNDDII